MSKSDTGDPWTSTRGGFDGRSENWARKAEEEDPNPPPVAGTLRAPGQAKLSTPERPKRDHDGRPGSPVNHSQA